MPTLLGLPALKNALSETGFIKNGKLENIDGIKYDFCLSPEILKAKFKQPINAASLPDTMKKELVIEPGEVVFVLTQETVSLPDNVMAILIPKRKLSHDGIMILGGLSIDPLYEGRLLIGLYNLSSTQYPIIPGRKLIGAHFYVLSEEEKDGVTRPEMKIHGFPDELIRLMQSYKPGLRNCRIA
jgi:dUTPase